MVTKDIHKSYYPLIKHIREEKLAELIDQEDIGPSRDKIFNVFKMPLQDIRVVLLGQDPYPLRGMATGYAFEPGLPKTPVSLRYMQKEIGSKIDFDLLREQGFFLLNAALTVRIDEAGSHLKKWKSFTINTIKYISKENPTIWVLLGKKAQEFIPYIYNPQIRKEFKEIEDMDLITGNIILTAPHPAAEAYSGENAGFLGSGIFKDLEKAYYLKYGKKLIWQTPTEEKGMKQKGNMQKNLENLDMKDVQLQDKKVGL